jgi:hypothetical protein
MFERMRTPIFGLIIDNHFQIWGRGVDERVKNDRKLGKVKKGDSVITLCMPLHFFLHKERSGKKRSGGNRGVQEWSKNV